MLHEEFFIENETELVKHYSDTYYIKQVETGIEFQVAVDKVPCKYSYAETERELEK